MKIYLGREFRINMDDYESANVTAGVTLTNMDLGVPDEEVMRMDEGQRLRLFNDMVEEANEKLMTMQLPVLEEIVPHSKRSSFTRRMAK